MDDPLLRLIIRRVYISCLQTRLGIRRALSPDRSAPDHSGWWNIQMKRFR